jgi:hypothetical protein
MPIAADAKNLPTHCLPQVSKTTLPRRIAFDIKETLSILSSEDCPDLKRPDLKTN